MPAFYMDAADLCSGPYAHGASTLPTELAPSSLFVNFDWYKEPEIIKSYTSRF